MSTVSLANAFIFCSQDRNNYISTLEKNFLLNSLRDDDCDLSKKIEIINFLTKIGFVDEIGDEIEVAFQEVASEGNSIPEGLQRAKGFVDIFRSGFIIPERRSPRTRTLSNTALSFYHATPPFHTSGYAMRTHALAVAARDFGHWNHRHHSRIGYPWDVRGSFRNPTSRTTLYDGIPYLHDRGLMGSRGNLRDHILAATASIRRAIYLERPSVVHAASAYVNALPVLIAAREMGIPFVYEVRGLWEITAAMGRSTWKETDRFKIDLELEAQIAKEADGVIAITEGVKQELIRRGVSSEKIVISPNGISEGKLRQLEPDEGLRDELKLDPNVPTIGYIGSFVEYEGLELLVEAALRLRKKGIGFNLLLVGDGPSYAAFKEMLSELDCEADVILPGRVPHENVERYYSLIDITVFPRLPYEVCELVSPLKPLEALLLKKLVIGSSVSGIKEIVEHETNGLLFEAGNSEALETLLETVLSELPNYDALREKGHKWVLANRPWEKNVATVEGIFERVAKPVMKAFEGSHKVHSGQVISVQTSTRNAPQKIDLTYRDSHWETIKQQAFLNVASGDKVTNIDAVVPRNAVALIDVQSGANEDISLTTAALETYYKANEIQKYDLAQTFVVQDGILETGPLQVTPGESCFLEIDVQAPAQLKNHVVIGINMLGIQEEERTQTGLPNMNSKPDTSFTYLQTHAGKQIIKFNVPLSVSEINVFLQAWAKTNLPNAAVLPTIRMGSLSDDTASQEITLSQQQKTLGESSTYTLLNADPVTTTLNVVPGNRYELSFKAQLKQGMEAPKSRSGAVTFICKNSQTGEEIPFPKMRHSKTLDAYYEYFTYGRKTSISFTAPENVDQIEFSARNWSAPVGTIMFPKSIVLEHVLQDKPALDWNVDRSKNNILLFADLDVNLVDGSAVWLTSMANALSQIENCCLHVVLRKPITDSPFVNDLIQLENCRIIDPVSHFSDVTAFKSADMPDIISQLDEMVGGFDHLVLRGFDVNYALTKNARLHGRLCPYLTDIPQTDETMISDKRDKIELIFRRAGRIFLQSSWLIDFVCDRFPDHAHKIYKLPPMLPQLAEKETTRAGAFSIKEALCTAPAGPLRIVYAGKMAPEWGILELFSAFDTLRADYPDLELHILGSKLHNPPENPAYKPAVLKRLMAGNGLVWRRNLDRQTVLQLLPTFTIGWSWRDPEFENANLELSTKLLEYGKSGLPVVLTRTDRYEELLGESYPLLAGSGEDALGVLRKALETSDVRETAVRALSNVLAPHDMARISSETLAPALPRGSRQPQSVLIAGHDLKFSGDIQAGLIQQGHEVLVDHWHGHNKHNESSSLRLLQRSDIVFCEWALGNLAWYAKHIRSDQKLITRLHAQEILTSYPEEVDWSAVHKVIFVGDEYRRLAIEKFAIPDEKCVVIPNIVNTDWFRPLPDHTPGKRLGLMGIVPWLKRPDRALNILRTLRKDDPDFTLSIKGKMPSDYSWMRNRPEELSHYETFIRSIIADPDLHSAVSFDGFGHDVPIWAREIDFILSTSDQESFHLAIPEVASTGAYPIILPWGGSELIYPSEWIVQDENEAAQYIRTIVQQNLGLRKTNMKRNVDHIENHFSSHMMRSRIADVLFE